MSSVLLMIRFFQGTELCMLDQYTFLTTDIHKDEEETEEIIIIRRSRDITVLEALNLQGLEGE